MKRASLGVALGTALALAMGLALPVVSLAEPASALAPGPEAAKPAAGLDWLAGEWSGEGTMMGKPSRATLSGGPALSGRFFEIRWRSDGVVPGGYEGRGFYRQPKDAAGEWTGHWYDSFGMARPLTATTGDNSFTVNWGAEATERGQSLYRLEGSELVIEDKVMRGGALVPFATHRLKRAVQGG